MPAQSLDKDMSYKPVPTEQPLTRAKSVSSGTSEVTEGQDLRGKNLEDQSNSRNLAFTSEFL